MLLLVIGDFHTQKAHVNDLEVFSEALGYFENSKYFWRFCRSSTSSREKKKGGSMVILLEENGTQRNG